MCVCPLSISLIYAFCLLFHLSLKLETTHGLLVREIFILSRLIDGAGYHYFKAGSPYLGLPHIRILFC